MKRKILIVGILLVVFGAILIVFPAPVHAQGTFDCEWRWQPIIKACSVVVPDNCQSGYEHDPKVCSVITDADACNAKRNNKCVWTGPTPTPAAKCDPCLWCQREDGNWYEEDKPEGWEDCDKCVTGVTLGEPGVWTALGCIPTDPADFVAWLLSAAIKIGGGIAFLLMLWGGFQIMTSTGNPEKLNQGKDILISAGVGLLFIIFSVLLLKIIGIDIFELPGFNK